MTGTDWLVIAGGAAAIAWVYWYFFLAERSAAVAVAPVAGAAPSAANAASPAEVTITVDGGYSPAAVRVRAGEPVRLVFDRRDTGSCSEEVVFADFGVRRFLPSHEKTVVQLTPPRPGTYEFTCGMGMLRGKLVAE